ncbi:MAG TPA: hypothetical protein VFN87_18510 [Solirubrobacteraceae bacterium]|nr:hypothetical protein [Solirubrobacteraceae bacterium]
MRRSLRPAAAALGVAATLALPSGALADTAQNLQCSGTYTGTYDNVTVPSGQVCNISDSTIRGNVTVQSAASLTLSGSGSVGGNLFVGPQAGAYEDSGWVIAGTAAAERAGDLSITGTVHGLLANGTDSLDIQNATIDGNVVSNRGVYGGLISSSVIRGNVVVNGTTGTTGIPAAWYIAGPQLDGSPQEIDGNLALTDNQATIYNIDNHIHQNLVCLGNTPGPVDLQNTVDGRSIGQCAAGSGSAG